MTGLMIVLLAGSWAYGHGTSVKTDKKTAAPGETVTVKGQGIGSGAEITLTLQGTMQDHSLGTAQGDEHGMFEKQVAIPSDVQAGSYTLVAAAGSHRATARLVIQESGGGGKHPAGQPGHGDPEKSAAEKSKHSEAEMQEARADNMEFERSITTVEKAAAWAMVLISGLLGAGLLIRERRQ